MTVSEQSGPPAGKVSADTAPVSPGSGSGKGGKVRFLTLDSLDGRTRARQIAEDIRDRLIAERGGIDRLDVRRAESCETWALLSAMIKDQMARYLIGHPIETADIATLINSRQREGQVIGEPEPRDITQDLKGVLQDGPPIKSASPPMSQSDGAATNVAGEGK